MSENRQTGTILRLKKEKGFGFIGADSGQDVFFHATALLGVKYEDLDVGDSVSFLVESTAKGPRALGIKLEGKVVEEVEE
jgi:CspA family cold shock protein